MLCAFLTVRLKKCFFNANTQIFGPRVWRLIILTLRWTSKSDAYIFWALILIFQGLECWCLFKKFTWNRRKHWFTNHFILFGAHSFFPDCFNTKKWEWGLCLNSVPSQNKHNFQNLEWNYNCGKTPNGVFC